MFKKMYYKTVFYINDMMACIYEALFDVCKTFPMTRTGVASWFMSRQADSLCRMTRYLVAWDQASYES